MKRAPLYALVLVACGTAPPPMPDGWSVAPGPAPSPSAFPLRWAHFTCSASGAVARPDWGSFTLFDATGRALETVAAPDRDNNLPALTDDGRLVVVTYAMGYSPGPFVSVAVRTAPDRWSRRELTVQSGVLVPESPYAPSADHVFVAGGHAIAAIDGDHLAAFSIDTPRYVDGLAGTGPNDLWLVGESGFATHWDGARWQAEETGTPYDLDRVVVRDGDVWAFSARALVHRASGRWQVIDVPEAYAPLRGVAASGPDALVAWPDGIARVHDGAFTAEVEADDEMVGLCATDRAVLALEQNGTVHVHPNGRAR